MPGSLSNEEEGQDDMDYEEELPGEGTGGGVSFTAVCGAAPRMQGKGRRRCKEEEVQA